MNKQRLRTLKKYLKTIPKEHFYLGGWTDIDGGKIEDGAIVEVGCGTTACAMGWACSIPEFRKEGLRLYVDAIGTYPVFQGYDGYDAAEQFFGIDFSTAQYLFEPNHYNDIDLHNPNAVIKRIDELLTTN